MNRVTKIIYAFFVLITLNATASADKVLFMATTTSTDNTGLLDYLSPEFTKDTGITVKWTATGTGKALTLGENCDADILMVHAPGAEKAFVKKGFGTFRREIMFNDFILIGPASDPAKIKGKTITNALSDIQKKSALFLSRGDQSGTHKKEQKLWKNGNLTLPEKEKWYIQTGQGMLATINATAERQGYTMTDRGTYIKYAHTKGGTPPLVILVEGDALLKNQYSVIPISAAHCSRVKKDLAAQFITWITGEKAQKLIGDFTLLGKQLFTPNAAK